MLQTFEGTINNGHIIFNDGVKPPLNAKVLITVLEVEGEVQEVGKPSLLFRGALKELSQAQKDKNNQEIQDLRNEWPNCGYQAQSSPRGLIRITVTR